MLNQLRVGKRLAVGFGLILAILVLAVGIGVLGVRSLHSAMEAVKRQDAQIMLAKDAYAHAMQDLAYIGAAAATENEENRKAFLEAEQSQADLYGHDLSSLRALVDRDATRQALDGVVTTINNTQAANSGVLELARVGKRDEALSHFSNSSCPKLALWDAAFDDLAKRTQETKDSALAAAEARASRAVLALGVSGLLALAAAGFLGWMITLSITRPIAGFQAVLARAADGDLTVQARVDSRDEIGELGTALNQTLASLRGAIRETSQAATAVANGATELSA